MEFKKNVLLKNYTTFKIGGPAKYFFIAKSKEDLISALQKAQKQKLPVLIIGGGSNLLVSEKGFNGLVVKLQAKNYKLKANKVFADAGVDLTKLAYSLAEAGLSGLEWAAGVPGTVGGAIYGSAQAFGTKISDYLQSVEAIDAKTLKIKSFSKRQCQFSLKNSIFKKNKNLIIASANFKFKQGKPKEIQNKIKEFLQYRKAHHPLNFPSAGSVFINPEKAGPAGALIQKCGLAGKKIGNAQISKKHCNFIINLGGAKSDDVLRLIKLAQEEVFKKFKIKLKPEIQLINC